MINLLANPLVRYSLVALVAVLATGFAVRSHYLQEIAIMQTKWVETGKAAQKSEDEKKIRNEYVSKKIHDEALARLAESGDVIERLRNSSSKAIGVCPSPHSSPSAQGKSDGRATGNPKEETPGTSGPSQVTVDPQVLNDVLQSGIDSINAIQLWRKWADEIESANKSTK